MVRRVRKYTIGGLLIAIGMILPQIFHLTGVPQSGIVFLPMHIPVLLAGFLLGPWFGAFLGLLCPLLSTLTTGMPAVAILPLMMIELALYGFFSGFFFHNLKMKRKKYGIILTLVIALLLGRMGKAIVFLLAAALFHIQLGGLMAVVISTVTGIPGVIIQIFIIPAIIYALKRGGRLDELYEKHEG